MAGNLSITEFRKCLNDIEWLEALGESANHVFWSPTFFHEVTPAFGIMYKIVDSVYIITAHCEFEQTLCD